MKDVWIHGLKLAGDHSLVCPSYADAPFQVKIFVKN